jgi:hypothetical protein
VCQQTTWRQYLAMERSSNIAWNETVPRTNPQNIFSDSADSTDDEPWTRYVKLVSLYTRRKLGFESDIIKAFTGVVNVLEKEMHSPFLLGLPVLMFDLFMMWNSGKNDRSPGFPSWSWAGWRGPTHPVYYTLLEHSKEFLISHTWIDWNYYDTKAAKFISLQSKVQTPDSPETMRQAYENYLSDFGSEDEAPKFPQNLVTKSGSIRFQNLPIHPSPILPMTDFGKHPCLLRGFTASVLLRFTQTADENYDNYIHPPMKSSLKYDISDVSGEVVGELNDHTETLKLELPDLEGIHEVLLLSDYRSYYEGVWDAYNVMVVKEVDGILYRLAIARVKHECLEKSFPPGPRWREFILG